MSDGRERKSGVRSAESEVRTPRSTPPLAQLSLEIRQKRSVRFKTISGRFSVTALVPEPRVSESIRGFLMLFLAAFLLLSAALPSSAASPAERGIDESFFAEGGVLDVEAETPAGGAASGAAAAPNMPDEAPSPADDSGELLFSGFKVMGSLVVVILLILAAQRFLKRSAPALFGDGLVKRIAVEPLGPNQFIQVIEVGGKVLVLGMNDKGITPLTELEGEQADSVRFWKLQRRETGGPGVRFRSLLETLGASWRSDMPPGAGLSASPSPLDATRDRNASRPRAGRSGALAAARRRLEELAL